MRIKMSFLASALSLAYATPAFACNPYFASSFMRLPARPTFGVGVSGAMTDPTVWAISGDVAMKLGEQMVVQPAVGVCTGGGNTDPFFGAGLAYAISTNSTMAVNLQSGISYRAFDGGNSIIVPIGGALSFRASETMSVYGGASLWWQNTEFEGGSASSTDPVVFGGVQLASGAMAWTIGGQLLMGDETNFGIVVGANLNRMASAIRHIGSLVR